MTNDLTTQRPTASSLKKFSECKTIDDALKHPEMSSRFAQAVPRHLSPDRFIRTMAMAAYKTPLLREAPMKELLGAMLSLASLGLEANTPLGHAYLIPFEKKKYDKQKKDWVSEGYTVQVVLGYKGIIELMTRSGMFVSVHGDVVYEGDDFSYEYGTNMHLRHVPKGSREGRKPTHAYAFVKLKDGYAFEVWPYADVLKIRDASQAYRAALAQRNKWGAETKGWTEAPWVKFERAMAVKTMIKQVGKYVPVSIEMANAMLLDDASDRAGMVFSSFVDDPALLDDMAGAEADAQTGQIEGKTEQEGQQGPETGSQGDEDGQDGGNTQPKPEPAPAATKTSGKAKPKAEEATKQEAKAEILPPSPVIQLNYDGEQPKWMEWYKAMTAKAAEVGEKGLPGFVQANRATVDKFVAEVPHWAAALKTTLGIA